MSAAVQIVQLYPRELGITGDRGNVRALEVRAQRAGLAVQTTTVGIGEPMPTSPDIVVIGNGPLSAMRGVTEDLHARSDELAKAVEAGAVVLAVGAGAEMLSQGVTLLDGEVFEALGVLPFSVSRTRERRVGYVIAESSQGRLIGFEDHASEWALAEGAEAFGKVVSGSGTFAHPQGGRGETVRYRNAFASNVQGPALPLNPVLTDELLRLGAERHGIEYRAGDAQASLDELAAGARAAIEKNVDGEVFTYMKV